MAALLLTPSAAGCTACPTALAVGTLAEEANELVLAWPGGGPPVHLVWPDGYSIRRDQGVLVVADLLGFVRARAGDYVELTGGEGLRGGFQVCGDFKVNPSSRQGTGAGDHIGRRRA
jgi:hypothetical protein